MNKFRVLTVTPFFPPDFGGISNHVLNLSTNLIKLGNDISVIAPKHLLSKKVTTPDKNFTYVFRVNSVYLPGWPYPTLRSMSIPIDLGLSLKSIMRKGEFDIIHVHGHHYPISWVALNSAHKHGVPSVLTLHGMYALNPYVLGGRSKIEEYFNKHLFTRILSKTTAVIGLTQQITDYAKMFCKKNMNFTISNGVDTDRYKQNLKRKNEYRQKYGIGKESIVILFTGRFEHVKGIVEFAQAAKNIIKNNRTEIIIVGGGSLESHVQSILNNVHRIHLLQWQPEEKIHEFYIASDIFVIPSKFEALPIAIMEAMNAGLHIVYTPVGGIPDILKEYPQKTMLQRVSTDEIHSVLTTLISNFSLQDISDSLIYAQKFDWNNITVDINNVYTECIDS